MYCIIDIETTGGSSSRDRITEIAIYKHDGSKVVDEFITLVNPEISIPYYITQMTGISNEMVAKAPRFFEIARRIVELTEGSIFVAHNVQFDYGFIEAEFKRFGYKFSRKKLCTVKMSRKIIPGYKSYSLGNICSELGISIDSRHRAADDAKATIKLFELLLKTNPSELANATSQSGKQRSYTTALDFTTIDSLPEATGVYFLNDNNGQPLYVGKSKSIRTRVLQHLNESKSKRAIEMVSKVAQVDFELTGSELIALIKESELIKAMLPIYNRLGRRSTNTYGLFEGHSPEGYKTLELAKLNARQEDPVGSYSRIEDARNSLLRIIDDFKLCQKMCGLYPTSGACFHRQIRKCLGACEGTEAPSTYNERVKRAINSFKKLNGSYVIFDKGRNAEEMSFVKVVNGKVQGYGFFSPEYCGNNIELITESMTTCHNYLDTVQAVGRHLLSTNGKNVIYL